MSHPHVSDERVTFELPDGARQYMAVALDCDEAVAGNRRFRRTVSGWRLTIPRPPLSRLEYKLMVTEVGGATHVVCDPHNSERVTTAFGDRSVLLLPGYTPPWWLSGEAAGEELIGFVHEDPALGSLPIGLWSPAGLDDGIAAPLLVVHDGPEYVELARLADYATAVTSVGRISPFRMLLMSPVERDEWYSANPAYVRASTDVLDVVCTRISVQPPLVLMGASLGGLAALVIAGVLGERCGGVFVQSGSFFTPRLDDQESAYPFFDRVVSAVEELASAAPADRPRTIRMTCGALEENLDNNEAMAEALSRQGHDVLLRRVHDLHNYTAWRDSLHPGLSEVLQAQWGAQG